MLLKSSLAGLGLAMSIVTVAQAAEQIRIVGSSTVYPFSTTVAERFGRSTPYATPIVESTGTGGGMKLFCTSTDVSTPQITNASRRIKKSEIALCVNHGIDGITEVKVGYDGIVIANSIEAEQLKISRKEIFLALAKELPNGNGGWVKNMNTTWKDVADHLPDLRIEVLGPPPTSGTRDAFVELGMEAGCKKFPGAKELKKANKKLFRAKCHAIREDGHFIIAGENDNLIVQKLKANKNAFGIFGFSFLDQNVDVIQGSIVEGTYPEYDAISDGSYPISRSLYFYVKTAAAKANPAIPAFIAEFTSDAAWGPDGYLADKGMIAMPEKERNEWHSKTSALEEIGAIN
ncbi:MAG: substrate-binding domain-containing protein [Sneathiella sp.]